MHSLSPEQLNHVSALGNLLLAAHAAGRLPPTAIVQFTSHLVIRIPAASPKVGDLEVHDDDSEYTVVVGHHTHHHVMIWEKEPRDKKAELQDTLDRLVLDLDYLTTDRTVIWSTPRGSGGTFSIDFGPDELEPTAEAWLWSGRPFPEHL